VLTRLFVTRPTLAAVVVFLALIGGALAALGLREQELPNVDLPAATIVVFYSAATPAQMRDSVVKPIEDQLAGAPQLQHLQSTTQQGFASITAVFSLNSSADADIAEVQRRLQAAQANLPADLPQPRIDVFDPGHAAVVSLSVASSTLKPGALSSLIERRIIPALEQIPGVGHVQANGLLTPIIQVDADPSKLANRSLTLTDLAGVIAGDNVSAPGGTLYETRRETGINIQSGLTDAAKVAVLRIPRTNAHIRDVASVHDADQPQRIFAYVDGKPSFVLSVDKTVGASEVDAARGVIDALPRMQAQFPGVTFAVVDDASVYTAHQLEGVVRTLAEGIVLVAIVMIFFLRSWRNAAAVLIAIPASLCATLVIMRIGGFTLDTVSLLAMTLITGILVDDSIVVLENTERHFELGEAPRDAALNGRLEIGLAAIVITLVDVVVFLPIAFLPGIVGKFLAEFALVVVVATLSSLAVSFTVTPALAGNWSLLAKNRLGGAFEKFSTGFDRVRQWYVERVLPGALARPWVVVGIALITLAGAIALIPLGLVGFDFDPAQDSGEVYVLLNFPGGTPVATTRDAVRAIEKSVDAIPDLRSETGYAGTAQSPAGNTLLDGAVGQLDVHLIDGRRHSTLYWADKLRGVANRVAPGANPVVIPVTNAHAGNTQPLDYLVSAGDEDPAKYAARVAAAMAHTAGAANVFSSAGSESPQLDVSLDGSKAANDDVSAAAAAQVIRAAFGGLRSTQVQTADGSTDVIVGYPPAQQHDLQQLKNVAVRTPSGTLTTIGHIAALRFVQAARSIDRVDRRDVVHVSANIEPGYALSNVQKSFEARVTALDLPSNVSVAPNSIGTQQNLNDTFVGMSTALALGLMLVFLLMVALYDSYTAPLYIMLSVPLAVVGALGALALAHETLNAFSLIGTVLLIGLVTKNGILLVDYANRAVSAGKDRMSAIIESCRTRFRPIVMTTVAMIFGMLPLALGLDPAITSRRGLGIVVIGGLTSSLLLTLVVIPVIYLGLTRKKQV
jgi:hydrophobic/amphiphilic exporter-1 (mainly G- bacteria), HAE1 family